MRRHLRHLLRVRWRWRRRRRWIRVILSGGGQDLSAGINPVGADPQAGGDPVAVRAQARPTERSRKIRTRRRTGSSSRGGFGRERPPPRSAFSRALGGCEITEAASTSLVSVRQAPKCVRPRRSTSSEIIEGPMQRCRCEPGVGADVEGGESRCAVPASKQEKALLADQGIHHLCNYPSRIHTFFTLCRRKAVVASAFSLGVSSATSECVFFS